ncbi:Reticulocyte-binding protein-like protein [Lachnellula subtilissima]|uniref:Reticulocyte-binding protein-like protein n=1 Tax=Lachnellula subtilissima TaxID=602034 RepID=A0A8H8RPF4_9HELO|nr:Reticulocyte-binding protein-like protein [Lachnellula subtilissima]
MAALHDALKTLGPLNYEEAPLDDLAPFLSSAFDAAQIIVDSVPIASASSPPSSPHSRSRSASSASDISLSNARPPPPEKEVEALQKEWKSVKMNAKDNPLGMCVYKLGGKDGKGAWFARRSVHEGLGFSKWKRGLEREFPETMKVQGGPGEGNIRGIGGEKRVAFKEVEGVGKVEVYLLSAQFPGPTTPRDFVTMFITSDQALKDKSGEEVPRHFMVISRPCIHPDTPPRDGYIRGQYESVEFIREIPLNKGPIKAASTTNLETHDRRRNRSVSTLEREVVLRNANSQHPAPTSEHGENPLNGSQSDIDLRRTSSDSSGRARGKTISFDRSRGPGAKGEVMDIPRDDDEDECNPIEWIMITRSDPGGSVPRFLIDRGTPGGIVADASKFLDWACAKGIQDLESDEDEGIEKGRGDNEEPEQRAYKHEHHHNHEKDLYNWQTNGHLAGIDEVATPTEEKNLSPEQTSADGNGIYTKVVGAAGLAGGYIASHTPAIVSDHFPHASEEPHGIKSSSPRHDSISSVSSVSSEGSFASALDRRATNETADGASLRMSVSTGLTAHDKELQKLEEKKRKLDEKLSLAHTAKEEEAIRKAQEKHEREVKKQEEKYKREVEKLERKKEKEAQKAEEKKRKAAEKDDKIRMAREMEEVKAEVELLRKEKEILRNQVGDLQAENTALAAKLGKLGGGDEILRLVREEVEKGAG